MQERAQALVAGGGIAAAVTLLDGYLAEFDGDWGLWLYFAGLCARSGRQDQAVAAYRASSRQLEGDGRYARARAALVCAARLAPRDESLAREVERLGRLAHPARPPPPPLPAPAPALHVTSLLPGRGGGKRAGSTRPAPSVDLQTDPHCPIFEFLDAERSGKPW